MCMENVKTSMECNGIVAKEGVEKARENVARMIHSKPSEILFLSGGKIMCILWDIGSESINQALIGGVRALNDKRRTIIASCFEHPAVMETLKFGSTLFFIYSFLKEEYGFTVIYLQVSKQGFVDVEQLELILNEDVAMVTCMLANNEIGSIQPIAKMTKLIRAFERTESFYCIS